MSPFGVMTACRHLASCAAGPPWARPWAKPAALDGPAARPSGSRRLSHCRAGGASVSRAPSLMFLGESSGTGGPTQACPPEFSAHSVSNRRHASCQVGWRDLAHQPLYARWAISGGGREGEERTPCFMSQNTPSALEVSLRLTENQQILMRLEQGQCQEGQM